MLAVGVYQNIKIGPLYHFWKPQAAERVLQLEGTYLGLSVGLAVDRGEKEISITVNAVTYRIRYLKAISNLVVIDGATGCVKFFQERATPCAGRTCATSCGVPLSSQGEGRR